MPNTKCRSFDLLTMRKICRSKMLFSAQVAMDFSHQNVSFHSLYLGYIRIGMWSKWNSHFCRVLWKVFGYLWELLLPAVCDSLDAFAGFWTAPLEAGQAALHGALVGGIAAFPSIPWSWKKSLIKFKFDVTASKLLQAMGCVVWKIFFGETKITWN